MELNGISDNLQTLIENQMQTLGYEGCNIKISKGTTTGDNYLSVIALVDVKTNTAEGKPIKLHWIAKSAHQNKQFRQQVRVNFLFEREIYMYTQILPIFEDLQKQKGLRQVYQPYPHFITYSLEDMCETVIMENLKAAGYIMKSRREPLDYIHTKYVFTHYAKFHALSFALHDHNPQKFQEFAKSMKTNFFDESNKEAMQQSLVATFTRAFKCYTEDNTEELKLLRYLQEHAYDVLTHSCNSDVAGNCKIFIHGDSWINNMLFKYENHDETQNPKKMVLLDFQLARTGSPAADLSYFLYTCTDGKVRDDHYEELLKHYHNAFTDFLKELGSDAYTLFPYEEFLDHLKRFSAYGVLMAMMVLHLMLSDSDEIPNITGDDIDLEAWEYETRNVDVYLARVKDIVRDVLKHKYDLYTKA